MRDASLRAGSWRGWDFAALGLAGLICTLTLLPDARAPTPTALGEQSPFLADVLRNLVLFAPLALALALAGHRARRIIAVCAGLAASIELLQLFIPGRTGGFSDLTCNTFGAVIALALFLTRDRWLSPPRQVSSLLGGLAGIATWAAVATAGYLMSPQIPAGPYFGGWTPEFEGADLYSGRILDARIGEARIAAGGPVEDPDALRSALAAHSSIRVRGVAGAAPARLAPLVIVIGGAYEEVMLVAVKGPDLLLRRWRTSARFLLEQPELTWPGALAGVKPGDALDLTATPRGSGVDFDLKGRGNSRVGLGPGRVWALLAPDSWVEPGLRPGLDALWLAILLFPVGLWLPRGWIGAPIAAAALAGLWVVPERLGLVSPAPIEWAGALAGFLSGQIAARHARRAATPPPPAAAG